MPSGIVVREAWTPTRGGIETGSGVSRRPRALQAGAGDPCRTPHQRFVPVRV